MRKVTIKRIIPITINFIKLIKVFKLDGVIHHLHVFTVGDGHEVVDVGLAVGGEVYILVGDEIGDSVGGVVRCVHR